MKLRMFVWAVALLMLAMPAWAAAPQLRTMVRPDTIEVGDSANVIVVVTPGDKVTDAQLTAPTGLAVNGPQMGQSFQVQLGPNGMTQTMSMQVTFRVRATREGTYTLGPPTVTSDGIKYSGDRVTLQVVAKGTLPQQRANPFDPFNMFGQGNPFGQTNPFDFPEPQQMLVPDVPLDPHLALDRARDSGTFLHAAVDKTHAVVGEQVTLAVYVYVDITQTDPDLTDAHEIGTSDFLRQTLRKDDSTLERAGFAKVAGRTYLVMLVRKYALFPLHSGELEITPMRFRTRYGERSSERIVVHVTEPPLDGRPPGYAVGDVGRFALSADVTPREVERGAAIAVNVKLSGWGNLPGSLTVPARPGVTWLDPEVKDDLHVLDPAVAGSDVWGGSRTFSYVVTPKKEGDLDLGDMTVSFYDPRTRAYDTARASLGTVHVKPGALAVVDETKVLASMPPIRSAMAASRAHESYLDDGNVFWGLLGAPTALFGLVLTGRRAARRLSEKAQQRKISPQAELKQRLRALGAAVDTDDGREIDGASIRVLEAGTAAHVGVNVRGVGGGDVSSVLERAGVDKGTATDVSELLEACAAARFSPDGVELDAARKRAAKARTLIDRLSTGASPSEG